MILDKFQLSYFAISQGGSLYTYHDFTGESQKSNLQCQVNLCSGCPRPWWCCRFTEVQRVHGLLEEVDDDNDEIDDNDDDDKVKLNACMDCWRFLEANLYYKIKTKNDNSLFFTAAQMRVY